MGDEITQPAQSAELVRANRQLLRELATREHLDLQTLAVHQAPLAQQRLDHPRCRRLAVGPGDVHDRERAVRVAEQADERRDPVERRVDWIVTEDLIHHRQRMGVEVSPGDEGDCLVTFASPGERARTMQKTGTKYKDENRETSGFQLSTSVYCFYFATILFG